MSDVLTPLAFQILLSVTDRARYGYDMIREIERQTDGAMVPKTGSLYTALQRMEQEGLIEADPSLRAPEEDERRVYYGLTMTGRAALAAELARLERFVRIAEHKRLDWTPAPAGGS